MRRARESWRLDARSLGYMAAGAALYAVFSWGANAVDAPGVPALKPGIAIPIISGALFGPIVGFVVGALGGGVGDLLTFGFFWNWDVGHGLVGLVAGITTLVGASIRRRWLWISVATAMGAAGVIVGIGFDALTDIWVANLSPDLALSAEAFPVAGWDLVLAIPLTAIVLTVWDLLRRRGRRDVSEDPAGTLSPTQSASQTVRQDV